MHSKYYNKAGIEVPSVTTVLKILQKDGLMEWSNFIGRRGINYTHYLEEKANFGSLVHELLEAQLENRDPMVLGYDHLMENAKYLVNKFQIETAYMKMTNIRTEISMVCDDYGGTIDIVCDILTKDGPVTILGDFKTSKTVYTTQFIQLGAYLNLIKINDPELYERIKQCMIFSITHDKITIRYLTKEVCEKYFTSMFIKLLDTYKTWQITKDIRGDILKPE